MNYEDRNFIRLPGLRFLSINFVVTYCSIIMKVSGLSLYL